MDDSLPSYESAVSKDPWELIARYLPSRDLCSAALVCQKWHDMFMPQLWGNPASHFGVQNDTVYVALTRFKRTLSWARLSVRELTHTLELPPAHAEIYGGPHYEWLRDILERLPCLQSLIVNGLPFLDHAALLTLRHQSLWRKRSLPRTFPTYGLRLLDASGCANATSTGLAEALPHLPHLVALDLSRTKAAKNEAVFSALAVLDNLRTLTLKSLSLKDTEFEIIARSIRTRVRSLDIRENLLTDSSARMILDNCLKATVPRADGQQPPLTPTYGDGTLAGFDERGSEDMEHHLRRALTRGFVGRLTIEDASNVGITHLYISKNSITVEGVSGLLRSKRLQVLDAGNLSNDFHRSRSLSNGATKERFSLPGAEKLTPILAECAAERMVYLRINHAVVTKDTPGGTSATLPEMEGHLGAYKPGSAEELEATEVPMSELDTSDTAVHEVEGDTTPPVELPGDIPTSAHCVSGAWPSQSSITSSEAQLSPGSTTPAIKVTADEAPEIKRGPAYAPEPVHIEEPPSPISPFLDATGGLSPMRNAFDDGERSPLSSSSGEQWAETLSHRNSTYHIEDRRSRLRYRQSQEHSLHPDMLPGVRTLVLTDVPSKTDQPQVAQRLVQFIKDCAEEAQMAKVRARFTYALPPGRTRALAEREYARSLFALHRIVLEIAPPPAPPKKLSTSWRQYPTKSSTEDQDSEAFWEAATHDFSFFGEEECGIPDAERGRHLPLAAMSGLMVAPPPQLPVRERQLDGANMTPVIDVVSEIAKFRKDRKAAYQAAINGGETDPTVEAYWAGDITVVRKPVDAGAGNLDYYGNRYEGGYLYR